MIEDSNVSNFERAAINYGFTQLAIESRRRGGQLPDHSGVVVYVAGASARTADRARAVERFWIGVSEGGEGQTVATALRASAGELQRVIRRWRRV
jgi:hypothetical protein